MDIFLESATEEARDSQQSTQELINAKKWEIAFLKKKCRNLELEQFYQSYMHRLRLSHLGLFIGTMSLAIIVHCLLLLTTVSPMYEGNTYVDICVYLVTAFLVWFTLYFNFRGNLSKRYTWMSFATSWVATTIMVLCDIGLPCYRAVQGHDITVPTYYSFILYSIYIFMPFAGTLQAVILGLAVSACYIIIYALIIYRSHPDGTKYLSVSKVISEMVFFACVNLLGVFFRMTREVAIRTTFLDKRQCVEENLLLRYARDQEKSLLLSIIPAQIANKIEQDVKLRIELMKQKTKSMDKTSLTEARKLFIEPHSDVSILYADVVNYTYLTTTLDVKTLVETLHDLFVRFDTASEEYNVLRIKFLGDCYYCVAGVPLPNEYHARCCVMLGLRMITEIRTIRNKRKLNIDMRIGVHSGSILSGVIGACKWQFDIWSKDVDIANSLEATGVAGRVHVSEQTLKLLDGEFMYESGTPQAAEHPVLKKFKIRSFLLKAPLSKSSLMNFNEPRTTRNSTRDSMRHDPSSFMQNTIFQYNQIRNQATLEMSRELDKMPIGRIQVAKFLFGRSKRLTQDEMEEESFRSNISSMFLFFKDFRWELMFMQEPDIMTKYSILFSYVILLGIIAIQPINEPQSARFWQLISVTNVVMLFFLIVAWYKKFWIVFFSTAEWSKPKARLSLRLYQLSDILQKNIFIRIFIYLFIIVLMLACTLLQLLDCDRFQVENEEIEIQLFQDGVHDNLCINPWAVTECFMLMVCMTFLFTRIPFILKMCVGVLIFALHCIIVLVEYDFLYEKSFTTNKYLYPEYSHIFVMFITLGIFYFMDRQTEFITKVDYNWKRQLHKKQDDAKFTNETITILINNILPSHVADIYMSKRLLHELYYEEYENVAVMFASIRNYETDQIISLRVLNEIICDFDEVLSSYRGPLKIEKIKVAGWTYMAACGLDPTRSEYTHNRRSDRYSSLMQNGRRSEYLSTFPMSEDERSIQSTQTQNISYYFDGNTRRRRPDNDSNEVVFVMAQFALELMRTMHAFNMENLQCEEDEVDHSMLRIGISNGPVMAGVVGLYKPHYDIWGNSVNMASRMDSTGISGKLQVTEETAHILESYDIKCTYRGETFVKGRGLIPTYFVEIDDNLNFVELES